jgi:hypothetical protein
VKSILKNEKSQLEEQVTDTISETKKEVYKGIQQCLCTEGYPNAASDFNEANINDLVYPIVSPVLGDFSFLTGHETMTLLCEKNIISTGGKTKA